MKQTTHVILRLLLLGSLHLLLMTAAIQAYSQTKFNTVALETMDDIGRAGNYKNVKKLMKKNDWQLTEESANDEGGKTLTFNKAHCPVVIVVFHEDGRLIVSGAEVSPLYLDTDIVKDLSQAGFKNISTEMIKNGEGKNLPSYRYAKKDYPFQFIANHVLNIAEMHTEISFDYVANPRFTNLPETLLDESFSDNRNNWLQSESMEHLLKTSGGVYKIHSKTRGSWYSTIPIKHSIEPGQDFDISVTLKKLGGTDEYYFGILIGYDDKTRFHHLAAVTGNGEFVLSNKGANPKDIIQSKSNIVRKGNATNVIRLQRVKGQFRLYINDHLAGTTEATELYGNRFGFQVWSGKEGLNIEAENLIISVS